MENNVLTDSHQVFGNLGWGGVCDEREEQKRGGKSLGFTLKYINKGE